MGRLAEKVALITGAGSGIGRETVRRFVAEGAKVVAADIDQDGMNRTLALCMDHETRDISPVASCLLDVRNREDWQAGLAMARERFSKVDIVANIAGIGVAGSIEELKLEDFQRMVDVNLTGVVLGCQEGIKAINASGGAGAIINMSSIGGLVGPSDITGYCATKGGVTTLTKSVAMHCAEKRYPIRCLSIHPTYVDTEMLDPVASELGIDRVDLTKGMAAHVPMGRVATPQDIANVVVFAASDEAAMVSGSSLIADGAQLAGPRSAHS
ncbi:MAG: SDR family oxidoreductase [Pseudomonadota bacterium]